MDLDVLHTFAKVAELGSFTRAAEQMGLAKNRVSARIQMLESQLGTRLLHRTTRSVRLTPDGEAFLARCTDLLSDADELLGLFQQAPGQLRGRLRVDMPNHIARSMVIPRLPEFLDAHPQIELELSTTDRRVDVVHEGFDCVLRVGALADSALVARRIGALRMANCASPAYLRRFGTPRTLDDLAEHRLVHYATPLGAPTPGWEYDDGGVTRWQPMRGVVTVNGTDAYQAACLAGLGLVQAPLIGAHELLAQGRLVAVMPAFVPAPLPVSLLYAARRHLPQRVQAFMDWVAGVLGPRLEEPVNNFV